MIARNEFVRVKKIFSSRSALSALSLPCTKLRPIVCAEIAANRAGRGRQRVGRADDLAATVDRVWSPSTASATSGPLVMKLDEVGEERLVLMFAVMRAGFVAGESA